MAHFLGRTVTAVGAIGLLMVAVVTPLPVRGGSHAVDIADFAFSPATLTIHVGDTVTWTNSDPVVHTVTSATGAFDSGDIATDVSYSVTFTDPGTYEYLCTPHPDMTGMIVVEPSPRAPTVPASAPPSGGGALPNVAMAAPRSSPLQLTGIGLVVMSAVAAGVVGWRRRPR